MKFYLNVLTLLGWISVATLPDRLSRAARELAAGQTASMGWLLLSLCLLWLMACGEELHVSLSSDRLRRFPIDRRSLFALSLLSRFLSPIAWLATIVTLIGLSPLLSARHPLPAIAGALFLVALAISFGTSVSFLLSLHRGPSERTARRATSIASLPGRLGPLVHKEQRALRRVLDVWMGLLPVLAGAAVALFASPSTTVRQAIFVIVCALNSNVTLNALGMDRPAGLMRYLILPIRGSDLLVAKNLAMLAVVGTPLLLLLAIDAWQAGVVELGAEIVVVTVLLLAHLAWGNVVSVYEPRRAEPYRFTRAGDPLTSLVSVAISSAPAVAVMSLLRSDSRLAPLAIAAIVLLTMAAYYGSLRYAGDGFERRIEIISRSLA